MMTSTRTTWGTTDSMKKTLAERLRSAYLRFEDMVIQPLFCLVAIPPMYLWEQWQKRKERPRR